MAPPLRLSLLLLCAVVIIAAAAVRSSEAAENLLWNYCPSDTNYTANSTFQTNLNRLLPSLASGAVSTGYYNGTEGLSGGDQAAYGLALCRGDVSSSECQSCLDAATQDIVRACPRGKRSTISYDNCLLRYSNLSFFGTADTSPKYYAWNVNNASNQLTFDKLLGSLMDDLINVATRSSPMLFAAKSVNASSFSDLYGLVQCTRDLSPDDCYRCLQVARESIPNCCEGKQGGKVYGQSCYLRFESYLFYNASAADLAPPPPPPPPSPVSSPPSSNSTSPDAGSGGKSNNLALVVAIPASVVAVLVILLVTFLCLRRKKTAHILSVHEDKQAAVSVESLLYDLSVIRSATNDFSEENKLGEGGFGPVYKGTLPDGNQIAVKRLSRSSAQGITEMKNEIVLVAKLQHKNLARLLGCCLEGEEKLLVYEYLPNRSLDKFLFDPIGRGKLDWATRYKIIQDIGRGLHYLHEDSRLKIIHRDLKASNILLDGNMNPKISDFGLAKLFDMDETQGRTNIIAGTFGYMAPEYAMRGQFSTKSDVFSFGVLVLEIITGRRNNNYQGSGPSTDVVSFVWQHWRQGTTLDVIDQSLVDRCPTQEVLRCVHVGLLCVQEDAAERPGMAVVILMLSSDYSITLPAPSAPAFLVDSSIRELDVGSGAHLSSSGASSQGSYKMPTGLSDNDVTVSELEPR